VPAPQRQPKQQQQRAAVAQVHQGVKEKAVEGVRTATLGRPASRGAPELTLLGGEELRETVTTSYIFLFLVVAGD
jgi:hypothetical protein